MKYKKCRKVLCFRNCGGLALVYSERKNGKEIQKKIRCCGRHYDYFLARLPGYEK